MLRRWHLMIEITTQESGEFELKPEIIALEGEPPTVADLLAVPDTLRQWILTRPVSTGGGHEDVPAAV